MPKGAWEVLLIFGGSTAFVLAGLWMIIWPDAAVRRLPDFSEDATSKQARWNARSVGVLMCLFGIAGLYVVLVGGLHPPGGGVVP